MPQSGGYNTPQLALGFHTRDSFYKCPKAVVFWDSIPTTIVGKIDKKFIKKAFWKGRGRRIN